MGGLTTTATYYDGIRVPATNLVGEENGGWGLITNQLNHERVALAAIGMQAEDFYEAVLAHARTPDPVTGRRPVDEPWVRSRLAEASCPAGGNAPAQLAFGGGCGGRPLAPGDASGVKFMGTESAVEVYRMCQEIAGEAGLVRGRFARRLRGRRAGADEQGGADQHLRGRGERGAAGDRRDDAARHEEGEAVTDAR